VTIRRETPQDLIDRGEPVLWTAAGRGEVEALHEIYLRHGDAAYALARRITGDPRRAGDAVVAAFTRLATAVGGTPARPRSLRVEVLDVTRRCAGSRAPAPGDGAGELSPRVRDVMALATATRSDVAEIGAVMGLSRWRIHRDMLAGLRRAPSDASPVVA
jgi:hypothetical protein